MASVAKLLNVCPLTAEERRFYKRCLLAEMDGITCATCPLRPRLVDRLCATGAPVCVQGSRTCTGSCW